MSIYQSRHCGEEGGPSAGAHPQAGCPLPSRALVPTNNPCTHPLQQKTHPEGTTQEHEAATQSHHLWAWERNSPRLLLDSVNFPDPPVSLNGQRPALHVTTAAQS